MTRLPRTLHMIQAVTPAIALSACVLALWPLASVAAETTLPKPVAALADRGLEILEKFDAPSGLSGYAATFQGRPMAIYLTEDGQHAVLGTLIDAQGQDMSAEPLERIVTGPQRQGAWEQLESASWIQDGSKEAENIVYAFMDPNCPYCHKFWQAARPWVESGQAQIRHILVGILKPDSSQKAATIFAADDPAAEFVLGEENYNQGGIKIADDIPETALAKVSANNDLMSSLGYFATPTILYKTKDGEVKVTQGLPQEEEISDMLGGTRP